MKPNYEIISLVEISSSISIFIFIFSSKNTSTGSHQRADVAAGFRKLLGYSHQASAQVSSQQGPVEETPVAGDPIVIGEATKRRAIMPPFTSDVSRAKKAKLTQVYSSVS
jgi:hypothetical protein